MHKRFAWFACAAVGCQLLAPFPDPVPQPALSVAPLSQLPILPTPVRPSPEVDYYEVTISGPEQTTRVWIYAPSGRAPDAKLPAVVIAAAGSDLMHGMSLTNGDRPEHLPYVAAGFVVVAYEVSGSSRTREGYDAFAKAQGGLADSLATLSFVRQQMPFVDLSKIFAVGHSSAGDAALLLATHAPSLRGVVVYNSAGDGCWFQPRAALKFAARQYPNFVDFCQRTRAANHLDRLTIPLFLFTSKEDTIYPSSRVESLAAQLRGKHACTFVEVPTGDHYASMLEQGIPAGIAWMRSLL